MGMKELLLEGQRKEIEEHGEPLSLVKLCGKVRVRYNYARILAPQMARDGLWAQKPHLDQTKKRDTRYYPNESD